MILKQLKDILFSFKLSFMLLNFRISSIKFVIFLRPKVAVVNFDLLVMLRLQLFAKFRWVEILPRDVEYIFDFR